LICGFALLRLSITVLWFEPIFPAGSINRRPDAGTLRVIRGGSFYNMPGRCRAACRGRYAPVIRNLILGFRVVRVW
jgi:formylglycine-generating enzyme required for sulfatase activity